MADPHEFDDVMPENTSRREPEQPVEENLFTRLVYMIIIALMISFAGTVIGVLALLQFIIMLVNQKQPNERIAELGTDVGIWVAKATRYQTAASEDKPWPWTELDCQSQPSSWWGMAISLEEFAGLSQELGRTVLAFHCLKFIDHTVNHSKPFGPECRIGCVQPERGQQFGVVL